jgi:tetratricopeptide (TPR) repeat protein
MALDGLAQTDGTTSATEDPSGSVPEPSDPADTPRALEDGVVPSSPEAIEIAARHFAEAQAAYDEGAYDSAAASLQKALTYDPGGQDLIYNLALVQEKLGDLDAAIANFRRVYEMEDDADEKDRLERVIQRLEGARERGAVDSAPQLVFIPPPSPAEFPPEAPRDERPRVSRSVGVVGSVGIAALAAGTALGIAALTTRGAANRPTTSATGVDDLQRRADRAYALAVAADLSFAVGIAAGAVAVTLHVGGPSRDRSDATSRNKVVGVGLEARF